MSVATSGIGLSSDVLSPAPIRNATLIAGPTASGKSGFALALARRTSGVIVNADSMQVYGELRILTARPTEEDEIVAPHRLYGHVPASRGYSAGAWLADVAGLIRDGVFEGRPAIFVGGTGLYFRALLGGLSQMPVIPAEIRARWRRRLADDGAANLYAELEHVDPEAAATLRPGDAQRILRALEVREASGLSILHWQRGSGARLVEAGSAERLVLQPDRAALVDRIRRRFEEMIAAGAVEEVRNLLSLGLDPALPATKAIGVPEIAAALAGRITLGQAIDLAATASRQYAKRQSTWFRNQLGADWRRVSGP